MEVLRKSYSSVSFVRGKPVLDIFARDENNNRKLLHIKNLPCYFYVPEDEHIEEEDRKHAVTKVVGGFNSLYGTPLKKVYVKKISQIGKLGREYHGFESDLRWDKKMLLDLKITDMFLYDHDREKAYTLDYRFDATKDVEYDINQDGFQSSVVLSNAIDKDTIEDAHRREDELSKVKPKIGHRAFEQRYVVFDIEVIVEHKEQLDTYDGEIVCIVLWDSYTERYYNFSIIDKSEKDMLIEFLSKLKELDFDVITGWNVSFDMNWVISRAERYDIDLGDYFIGGKTWVNRYRDKGGNFHEDFYLGGRVLLDSMELYINKTYTTEKLSSYSLKPVAVTEGFEEWDDLGAQVKYWWEHDPVKVIKYCGIDVERTVQIIKKKDLIGGAFTIAKFYGCQLDEVMTNSKVIESMAFLLKKNRVLPNIVYGKGKAKVKGAMVLDTAYGIHKNVGIFDAASLYPSIIQGLNISPECLVKSEGFNDFNNDDTIKVNVYDRNFMLYKKDKKLGLMTEVITEMRKMRESIRANRQVAVEQNDIEKLELHTNEEKVAKGVLASVYGVMAFSGFRLFNADCANIITGTGRIVINKVKETLNSENYKVIYGDTDSVFIQTHDLETGFKVQQMINELMIKALAKFGITDKVIAVNFEKFFKWLMFSKKVSKKRKTKLWKKDEGNAKKRYIGMISHKESGPGKMKETNELYYRGFELRRSDASLVLKDVMKEFFTLLESDSYIKAVDYLREIKSKFSSYSIEYIAMPRSVNAEDANNPWANGMRYSKEVLKFDFNNEEMPKLIYVKNQHSYPKTDVICYQDGHKIPDVFEIDYDIMFDKIIRAKFEPIIESLGLFWDTSINNQSMLDSFC